MIHGKLREGQYCPVHQHRRADARCDRCLTHFCSECLVEYEGRMLCERCLREEKELARMWEESRLTPKNILRRIFRREVLVGVIVLALVAGGLGAFITFFWRSAGNQVDYSLIRRIRAGFTQSFTLGDEGFDFAEILNEGEVRVSSQSVDPAHALERLNDGLPDQQVPSWRSADAGFPIELLFVSQNARPLAKLVLWNHPDEDPGTFIRDFEVWTSPVDPKLDATKLTLVGRFTADQVVIVQRFEFEPAVPTLFTLVRVNSNHGSPDFISAAEIGLFTPGAQTPVPAPPIAPGTP